MEFDVIQKSPMYTGTETVSGFAASAFLIVTVRGADVEPTIWSPNARLVGVTFAGPTALPESATLTVLLPSPTAIVPVRAPRTVGAKTTPSVPVAPGASVQRLV